MTRPLAEAGDTRQAGVQATMTLALADKAGDPYEQARAHHLLAGCNLTGADAGSARRHQRRAAQLFARLGVTAPAEQEAHRADLAARSRGVAHQQCQKPHKFLCTKKVLVESLIQKPVALRHSGTAG